MSGNTASIFASTIGRCQNVNIDVDTEGEQSISIKLHPAADVISLIHSIVLEFTSNKGTVLEAGIASLLIESKLPFSEKILETRETHLLTIPIKRSISIIDASHVTFYMRSNGRILSKEFDLQ